MKDLLPEYVMQSAAWLANTTRDILSVGTSSYGFFTSPLSEEPTNSSPPYPTCQQSSDDEDEKLMYIGR